ncbi:MAG: hypothetical protein JWP19_2324 [Rhodoglobus sp.]|nr:hypothetical protein [Rhodoglobus sp.]
MAVLSQDGPVSTSSDIPIDFDSILQSFPEIPEIREVSSPLTRRMLRPLDPRCRVVQFKSMLSDRDLKKLAKFLRKYPRVSLRAYGGYDGSIRDLEFLRHFPGVTRFAADALYGVEDITGLRHLNPSLQSLSLGRTTDKRLSLAPLSRFTELRQLALEGHTKDIGVVATLTELKSLTLRSVSLPDLSTFAPLRNLKMLDLKLGGTNKLDGLSAFPDLRYLELWMIRGLDDLNAIRSVPRLEYLFLQALKNVTALPDLSTMTQLRKLHIETLKGLTDVRALATAPALEEVSLFDMRQLAPEDLAFLANHPTLAYARFGLGSLKRNKRAMELVGRPVPTSRRSDYFEELLRE